MTAWYNEIDPFKAEVLREAIKAGAIAPGVVDERSIADVRPADLVGFAQCHFFAGGGFWSLSLRQAGWPDWRPCWTGSCPCPSFSAAGKGAGFRDPRHLWPNWFQLIEVVRPAVVFGEQVASATGHGWLDLVQSDLEGADYAVGAAVLGACSVGAPHIRQRLYFVAKSLHAERWPVDLGGENGCDGRDDRRQEAHGEFGACGEVLGVADARHGDESDGCELGAAASPEQGKAREQWIRTESGDGRDVDSAGPLKGYWRDADWIGCRDGKLRPVEPGTFPLANGSPARVGRLRLYGDAICVPAAQAFIEAFLDLET